MLSHCMYNLTVCNHWFCRFAYMEFAEKESVELSMALDDSLFRGRQIKVRCPFAALLLIKLPNEMFHDARVNFQQQ